MAKNRRVVALIGDVTGSRQVPDRPALQRELKKALTRTNKRVLAIQPLGITLGDEFQGVYADLASALDAALRVRLALLGTVSVRFGIGVGEVVVPASRRAHFGQDGPAWWGARDCIERLRAVAEKSQWPPGWLTAVATGTPAADAVLNAFLICRDQIIGDLTSRDARAVLRLFDGARQGFIAKELGVTQSAVSQRSRAKGWYAVLRAHQLVQEVDKWPF